MCGVLEGRYSLKNTRDVTDIRLEILIFPKSIASKHRIHEGSREVLQNENVYKLSLYAMKSETSHELSQLWTRNLQGTRNELS